MATFQPIYQEFCTYKSLSGTHSRPTNAEQKQFVSISDLFGRDRFNADDELKIELSAESLTHLHTIQEGCTWEDSSGYRLAQWSCTSNSYLIYSYFVHLSTRYYFVVDFIDNNAHASWKNTLAKKIWLSDAKIYRESIIGKNT